MKASKTITSEKLDRRFDNGEDVSEFLDWSSVRRLGVTRQARIRIWIAERLEKAS